MNNNSTVAVSVHIIAKLGVLLALTLTIQMAGMPQYLTGPLVNAMLIISALSTGFWGSAVVGALTPIIAFMRGILPPMLGPAIPFIVLSNLAFVFTFLAVKNFNEYVGIAAAAVIKFLILAGVTEFIIQVLPQIARMLQLPQLITAISGGIFAIIFWRVLQKANNSMTF